MTITESSISEISSQKTQLTARKLNKELINVLDAERKVREYKEYLTKLQRDMYSKKDQSLTIE